MVPTADQRSQRQTARPLLAPRHAGPSRLRPTAVFRSGSPVRVSLPPASADTATVRALRQSIGIGALLLTAGCSGPAAPRPRPGTPAPRPVDTIRVQFEDRGETAVRDIPLDAYAAAAALSEF